MPRYQYVEQVLYNEIYEFDAEDDDDANAKASEGMMGKPVDKYAIDSFDVRVKRIG